MIDIRDFLYADDAALVFESRESMERGLTSLIASGKRWGLEVHAATDSSSSEEGDAAAAGSGAPRAGEGAVDSDISSGGDGSDGEIWCFG